MKRLGKTATKVFQQLHVMTKENYLKLDNAPGTFMPGSFRNHGIGVDQVHEKGRLAV